MENEIQVPFEFATWVGRSQSFAMVSRQCSAAQAECLRQIRESGKYTSLSPNWDDFCRDYAGMSRPKVDALIRSLEEFGAEYFRFAEIVRVTPDTYRRIAPAITGDLLEFEGESIPITPENAPKIRRAVQQLRADLKESHMREAVHLSTIVIQAGFDTLFRDMERLIAGKPLRPDIAAVRKLIAYCIDYLNRIERTIPKR